MSSDALTEQPPGTRSTRPAPTTPTIAPRTTITKPQLQVTLLVRTAGQPDSVHVLPPFTIAVIGRGPLHAATSPFIHRIGVMVPWVSRSHAILEFVRHRGQIVPVLRDSNSSHGVYHQQTRVFEIALHSGLEVSLGPAGPVTLLFREVKIVETPTAVLWPKETYGQMIARSAARREMFHRAEAIATTPHPGLLVVLGGRGVGKKLITLQIAERRRQEMVVLNCSALSSVPSSQHAEPNERPLAAIIEPHRGAIVYVEHVEDLSRTRQAELFALLKARRVAPTLDRTLIVFSLRHDLWALLDDDTFHAELYAELARAEVLAVPSLAECGPEEVRFMAEQFLAMYQAQGPQAGATHQFMQSKLSEELVKLLQQEAWPGNVGQLREVINRTCMRVAAEQRPGSELAADDVQLHSRLEARVRRALALPWKDEHASAEDELARIYMEELLIEERGVITRATERANMSISAFRELLRRIGVHMGQDQGIAFAAEPPTTIHRRVAAAPLAAPKLTKRGRSRK